MSEFIECEVCSKKIGAALLCRSCSRNRSTIDYLEAEIATLRSALESQRAETIRLLQPHVVLRITERHDIDKLREVVKILDTVVPDNSSITNALAVKSIIQAIIDRAATTDSETKDAAIERLGEKVRRLEQENNQLLSKKAEAPICPPPIYPSNQHLLERTILSAAMIAGMGTTAKYVIETGRPNLATVSIDQICQECLDLLQECHKLTNKENHCPAVTDGTHVCFGKGSKCSNCGKDWAKIKLDKDPYRIS